jgi:hypothetical protein
METQELSVNVGDRVLISKPRTTGSFTANMERFSTVSAVRPKSFDAGGLCFRNDGREWGGHNRARLIAPEEAQNDDRSLAATNDTSREERAARAQEDAILAFLLSSRHEKEWLKLGLPELRRIAALHGIPTSSAESQED